MKPKYNIIIDGWFDELKDAKEFIETRHLKGEAIIEKREKVEV